MKRICKKYRSDWDDLIIGEIYNLNTLKNITTFKSNTKTKSFHIIKNEDVDEYFYTEKEIRKLKLEKICQKEQ